MTERLIVRGAERDYNESAAQDRLVTEETDATRECCFEEKILNKRNKEREKNMTMVLV